VRRARLERLQLLFCALIVVVAAVGPVGAAEYHVDPSVGSDSNPGTAAQPWWSLRHALDQIRAGDTLYVHEGPTPYPVDGGGTLYVNYSGTAGNWITIKAYPGDHPVISIPAATGLYIGGVSHVIIDGLGFDDTRSSMVVRADNIIIRNCTMANSSYGPHVKTNGSTRHRNILIDNCTIYGCADIPIFPDNVDGYVIRNNTLYDADSVLMDPGGVANLVVEGNFAYNTGKWLGELKIRWGDRGGSCRGGIVRRNVFVNGGRYLILLASADGCAVYNNTLCNESASVDGLIFMQFDNGGGLPARNKHNLIKNNIFTHLGPPADRLQPLLPAGRR